MNRTPKLSITTRFSRATGRTALKAATVAAGCNTPSNSTTSELRRSSTMSEPSMGSPNP